MGERTGAQLDSERIPDASNLKRYPQPKPVEGGTRAGAVGVARAIA
jgi:hypothetical protein